MKRKAIILILLFLPFTNHLSAQYPPFTKWYQNPLGFKPLNLHTVNGIIIPAVAATTILLFTQKDSTIRNKISYFNDAGISFGYSGSKTTVYQNNTGVLLRVRKYMSLGAEFSSYYVHDDVNNTWGFGIRPFVRFYPVYKENFNLFFQSGAGLIYFLNEFPQPSGFFGDNRTGTRLNGNPKYGIGAGFRLGQQLSGTLGLWHIHVSNGNHPSEERNPGHDSNGFSIGLIYQPGKRQKFTDY